MYKRRDGRKTSNVALNGVDDDDYTASTEIFRAGSGDQKYPASRVCLSQCVLRTDHILLPSQSRGLLKLFTVSLGRTATRTHTRSHDFSVVVRKTENCLSDQNEYRMNFDTLSDQKTRNIGRSDNAHWSGKIVHATSQSLRLSQNGNSSPEIVRRTYRNCCGPLRG